MKKINCLLITVLFFSSCSNKPESINKEATCPAPSVAGQRTFTIDPATTGLFAGAVKGRYIYKKGRDGFRIKVWTLLDKDDHNIFSLGISGNCFLSTKREFDAEGELSATHILISRDEHCFDDPERFYADDTLLLHALTTISEAKWKAIEEKKKMN